MRGLEESESGSAEEGGNTSSREPDLVLAFSYLMRERQSRSVETE